MQQTARQVSARLVAFVAAICMVAAMLPAMAFADNATSGSFTLSSTALEVTSGSTGDVSSLVSSVSVSPSGSDYHFDYVAADGTTAFTVNKHSGALTASSVSENTTGTVTVYLLAGSAPTNNSGKPCTDYTVLSSQTVTVTVAASSTYGYQGNNMTMKMTSPAVTSYSGSNSTGWVNQLGSVSAASDGYYYFTVKLSSGFSKYNTASSFAERNAGNIVLKNSAGTIDSVSADNDGSVQIYSTDNSTKTVQVRVLASAATGSNVTLVFGSGFRGNNDNNTLGCTVGFVIG